MLSHTKSFLRERLSEKQLAWFRDMRARLTVEAASARVVQGLGTRRAVGVKERMELTGRLDYLPADIRLGLDSTVELMRLNACTKEPDTVRWLERNMRAGDVLYDIGANVGAYSFVAHAIAGGRCRVIAFEPSFSTFAALCRNVALNGCGEEVTPLQVALSSSSGLQRFNYRRLDPGASQHSLGGDAAGGRPPVFVQSVITFRLDQLVREFELPPPNHIKIDVDGPELDVLRGAGALLANPGLRSILVEVDEAIYPNREVPAAIEPHGFRLIERYGRIAPGQFNYIYER